MRSLAFVWLLALTACSEPLSQELAQAEPLFSQGAGSLKLPLRGHDQQGNSYRLRQGTLELSGTALMTLAVASEGAPKSLSTPLPSGSYHAFLRAGFQLVEVAADGSERSIDAQLVSPNPARFAVDPRLDQELHLTFRSGERTIALGGQSALKVGRNASPDALLASAPELAPPSP